jgi:hypothetical protein
LRTFFGGQIEIENVEDLNPPEAVKINPKRPGKSRKIPRKSRKIPGKSRKILGKSKN